MKHDSGVMKINRLGKWMITIICILLIYSNVQAQGPTITSFTPASGPVGTSVTITGTNFSTTLANNIVYFGATKATVTAALATQLTVTAPIGATYLPISVLVNGATAYSSKPFIVTFPSSGTGIDASSFSGNEDFAVGNNPLHSAIADFNGDGKADLAVTNSSDGTVSIFRNISTPGSLGPSSFASPFTAGVGVAPQSVTAGDVNGDGRIDLLTSNVSNNNFSVLINTSTLGSSIISFATHVTFGVGSTPTFVALSDLDNDGRPDAVVTNSSSNTISVLKNTTSGGTVNFAAKVDFVTGGEPTQAAIADLDNDGKPEIVVSNYFPGNTLSIFRNVATPGSISSGSFEAKADYVVGAYPANISIGDFDGDGKPDLAVDVELSNIVSVLRNTTTSGTLTPGSFSVPVNLATIGRASSMAIADLDGDGKLDIASTNFIVASVSVLKNNCSPGSISTGSFSTVAELSTCAQPHGLSIGDLDGDGKPDFFMVSKTNNTMSVLRNLISGPSIVSFSPQSGNVGISVTIDGLGFSSIPSGNIVYFGATKAVVTDAAPTSLTVSVPSGASYEPISVTVNGLIARTSRPFSVTFSGNLLVSAGSFSPKVDFATGTGPIGVAISDLDGDGKPDIAVTNPADNTVSVLRNSGSPGSITASSFQAKFDFATDINPERLAIGDLNGDGKPDLVTVNNRTFSGPSSLSVFQNTSTPGSISASSFAAKVDFATNQWTTHVALADLDNDGKTDMVATSETANKVSVFRNAVNGPIGSNSFAAKIDFTTGSGPTNVAVGDVDNDGKPDVVVTNSSSNTVSVLKNTSSSGAISFAAKVDFSAGLEPNSVAIGDLDGDGKPDLTVANFNNHTISLYRNTATDGVINSSSFASRVIFTTGSTSYPIDVALANLDGDAKVDIVVVNRSLWTVSVFRNTTTTGVAFSTGSLAAKQDFNTASVPYSFAVNDLDLDGMPEIVPSSWSKNTVSVLRNTNGLPTPVASGASSIAQTSFTANWASVATATEYRLDVSSNDFVGFVPGYNDLVVAGTGTTSKLVTGLTEGVTYKYRVRSSNSTGASTNSASITVLTLPATPVSASATLQAQTSFTANWAATVGVVNYRLDVSLSTDNFTPNLSGYNNLSLPGGSLSLSVTGLEAGTNYVYRVRAENGTGASGNSDVKTVLTIPPNPENNITTPVSSVSTTGFAANWSASTGAASYRLDVSLSANNFSPNISGYDNLIVAPIPGTEQSKSVIGLTPGTTYKYRFRSVNASGTSGNSPEVSTITICSPPTANAAGAISATGFTASWSTATGAADYKVDVATDASFAFAVGSYNNLTVVGTSLNVTGLAPGTNYYYRVRANNASGSSASSSPINMITLPAAPLANDALSIATTTFTANWNPVPTATGYLIDVSTVNTFSPNLAGYDNKSISGGGVSSTSVTVPTAGITYYYRVRAINSTGASANSNIITTLLKPAVPVATTATSVTAVSFTANWGSASGATEYNLEVSSDNFVSNIPGYDNLSLTGTTVSVTSLIEGTTYKYRVRAVNALWSSANSNTITIVTAPPAPVATSAISVSTTGFTAKWNATAGAASYQLDVSPDNFSTFVSGFNNTSVTGTSAVLTGLTAGATYQYRLRAVNASGTSGNSNNISTSTLSVAPTASAASSITSSGFTASWTSVTGASDYRIDVSTSSGFGSFVGSYNNQTVGGTSIAVSGLVSGTTYYYRVRANNASGASVNSNIITTLIKPAAPNATDATAVTVGGFTANWDAVAGSTGYKLDVSLNDFVSNVIGYSDLSVASTSQLITGLVAGTTYKFRVRSLNATGASDNSNVTATVTVPSASVATNATSVTTTGFTANWNIVTGAPAYFLDVSTDNLFGSFISGYNNFSTSSLSQTITGMTAGTNYYYRVRAANVSGSSANSPTITVATLPVAPTSNSATIVTSTGFTANWTTVAGAVDYRIDVSTDNAFSSFVGSSNQTVIGTSLALTGLLPGTNYYYRARAANASGSSASSITIAVLTLPAAPVANDAVSVTSTTFNASWNPVSTATGYFIDVSTVSNFLSFVAGYENTSVATTSITVTVPTAGTTYYYRVRSISTAGTSSNSNIITILLKPASPVASIATAVTADGFTANWSTVPGVLGYYLDVSSNNFSGFLPGYDNFPLSGISQIITGLNAGINYQYRVRSYNVTGSSANSATITTITRPPAPVAISASAFTATSFTANWQATTGASSYRLDVSSDPSFGSFFPGFENRSVTGTSSNVSGLTPGVAYYYQARAVNVSGTSPNSNSISSTNIPPPPPVLNATSITTTSFTANWSTTSGALSYLLDVSDNNFSSFVSGYNDLSVTGNSQSVTGLAAGTAYQYRVRAANASGISSNSSSISVQTLPAEPSAQATAITFSAITTSTMNVSFAAAVGGANGYVVIRKTASSPTGLPNDGVTYSSGSSIGDGTVAYVGSATNFSESGLSSGIVYFYNVYAYNGNGISTNYNTNSPLEGSKVTLPDAPVTLAATLIGQTLFNANWILASGATGYFIDVSTDDFSTFVTGYNNQPTGNVTSFGVNSLTAATAYQYRVRTVNASGSSINSTVISLVTIPPTPTALAAAGVNTTGFTANWSGTGTTNFFIDVSSDNFSTFVTGYNNLAVNGASSQNITGLNIGTAYKYRVRSSNATGVSPSSNAISANTLVADPTAQPTALTFSNVTINSLDVSFAPAIGSPTGYIVLRKSGSTPIDVPVDGIVYSVASIIGSSTVVNVGGTSFSDISLINEMNYFYSIYSYNGSGASINYLITGPLQGNKSTLAVEPTSQPTLFKFVSSTASLYSVSFTPTSASAYLVLRKQGSSPTEIPVDGVPYLLGGTLGSSTVAHFASASLFDESLLSNSTYFYSVFSFNGSGASVNYRITTPLTASVLTLPDAPVAKPSSNNTTTTFDANWDAVSGTGAVTYEVEVSKDDFSTLLQSLPLINATTVRINNLSPSTDYQYRVRAKNARGLSTNSTAIAARTSDVSLANALKINTNATSTTLAVGFNQTTLLVNVSGGTGIRSAILKYRKILGGAFTTIAAVDKGSDNFEVVITESLLDELGLEFYFEATDQTGIVVKSNGNSFIYLSKSAAAIEAIPFTSSFDGTSGTYEMFSVPYVLTDKNIAGIFDELGAPDKTQWRLFHFKGNKYIEYPDNITTLEMGKGYWFNAKEKIDIRPGAGELSKANQSTPFQITFEKGWNQIGNPYPFNIDWKTIKDANEVAGLNALWLFEKGAYTKKDVLATWKGAFVFSDNGGTVNFPVSAKTSAPGRTKSNELPVRIDEEAWQLPLILSLNGMNQISSVGMHPDAKVSKDKFDEITMPRFIDYLEMDTYHEEFFAHNFSSDVVPTTNTSSWLFTVSSNQKGSEATISWDQQALFNSRSKLALLDLQTHTLVDMKTTSMYRFSWTEGRQFKILYSKEGDLLPGITLLGNAYPNPFNTAVTIPFMLEQDQSNVEVIVYDMLGRKVKTINKADVKAGIHNLEWGGANEQGDAVESGMYFYQLRGDKGILSSIKRLLKQ